MKRPKQSDTAKSVDKLPSIRAGEERAKWGVVISVAIVALTYFAAAMLMKGCVHGL